MFTYFRVGRKYGVKPKFIKMQQFHLFLFYLCRSYEGQELNEKETEEFIEEQNRRGNEITDDVKQEIKAMNLKIYRKHVDWQMFVPPLPKHAVSIEFLKVSRS